MSDSDKTNELDNYGVWVKKPPRTVSSENIDDLPDFAPLDDNSISDGFVAEDFTGDNLSDSSLTDNSMDDTTLSADELANFEVLL